MASSLVGQYQITTFTSPVNGTSPINANEVRGNDNVIKSAYDNHDSDAIIHFQDSPAANRPTAGTVGRKWLDNDTLRIYYDTGSVWSEVAYATAAGPTFTGQIKAADGTVSAPAYSWTNDLDCGFYRIGANNIGFALNGAKVVDFLTTGVTVTGTTTSTAFVGPLTGDVTGNVTGNVSGNAGTATALQTARTINGVSFNGTANITISATVANALTIGAHLTGGSYDGSTAVTIATDATSANTVSTIVARDGTGAFAAGAVTVTTLTMSGALSGATTGAFSSTLAAASYLLGSDTIIDRTVTNNQFYDRSGRIALYLGGSNNTNFYDNTTHTFRTQSGGANMLTLTSSSASFTGAMAVADKVTISSSSHVLEGIVPNTNAAIMSLRDNASTNIIVIGTDNSIGDGILGTGGAPYAATIFSRFNFPIVLAVSNAEKARLTTTSLTLASGVGMTVPGAVTMSSTLGVGDLLTVTNPGAQTVVLDAGAANDNGVALVMVGRSNGGGTRRTWRFRSEVNAVGDLNLQQSTTEGGSTFQDRIQFTSTTVLLDAAVRLLVDNTTDATTTTDGSLQTDGGISAVKSAYIGDTLSAKKIKGNSSAPTIAAGGATIAGTGASASVTGTDTAGIIELITGTGISTLGVMFTLTFNSAYGAAPYVVITNANSTASLFEATGSFYAGTTTTTITLANTTTQLSNSTTYKWYYTVIA